MNINSRMCKIVRHASRMIRAGPRAGQCVLTVVLWSWINLVDHGLSQGLQHLTFVIIKVSINLIDAAVFYDPQLALSLCDEPGIMTHNDHSWTRRKSS